jgi:hypothetical protein
MKLWLEAIRSVRALAGSCRRKRTFMWLLVVVTAWLARPDLFGVTSLVRGSFLAENT